MCRTDTWRDGEGHGGSGLTTDPAEAAPKEGAEPGEQPEEPLRKLQMVAESSRPKVEPKKPDGAKKILCTSPAAAASMRLHRPLVRCVQQCWRPLTFLMCKFWKHGEIRREGKSSVLGSTGTRTRLCPSLDILRLALYCTTSEQLKFERNPRYILNPTSVSLLVVSGYLGTSLLSWSQRAVRRSSLLRKHLNKVQLVIGLGLYSSSSRASTKIQSSWPSLNDVRQTEVHTPNCSVRDCDEAGCITTMIDWVCERVRLHAW